MTANAHPNVEHRTEPVPNEAAASRDDRRWRVEYVSTHVVLSSHSSRRCHACDAAIAPRTRHKCVTLRGPDGEVTERNFCDEDCLGERH